MNREFLLNILFLVLINLLIKPFFIFGIDLTVQNRELLHAFRTQEASEYDLASILPTMEVLGRAQQSAENKGNNR